MTLRRTILAIIVAVTFCLPAKAADFQVSDEATNSQIKDSDWRFQITAYVWATSVKGDVRPTGPLLGGLVPAPTVHVDKSFKDILKDLDGAFFLQGTVRRDRFVLFGDFFWASASEGGDGRLFGGLVPVAADATVDAKSGTLLAGYSIISKPALTFDVLGGARAWHIKATASASATFPIVGPLDLSLSYTESWVDPIVATRMRVNLDPNWSVILYGDIGGFGVGSKSTWQFFGTLNYQATEHLFLSAGYRHIAFDYRENGRFLDLDMGGPVIGATWRF